MERCAACYCGANSVEGSTDIQC